MSKFLKISVLVFLMLGLIAASACASGSKSTESVPSPTPMPAPMPPGASGRATDEAQYRSDSASTTAETDRKIVRTGRITLEVKSVVESMDGVSATAGKLGGYVVSSNKYKSDDRNFGTVVIRVPVERFDEALAELRQLAVEVSRENTDSRDITEEYTDLKAQLRNLEATEAQYLALLAKAQTVEDILKVQRELSNVRGEIERVKGRIQYLERTSDMSLIEVSLREAMPLGEAGWSALKTLQSAVRGLITLGRVLADALIWLVILSPVWVAILIVVLVLRRRRRKVKV